MSKSRTGLDNVKRSGDSGVNQADVSAATDSGNRDGQAHASIGIQQGGPIVITAPPKSKVDKAQSLLTVISTSIGIMGALGSLAVWSASAFYVGHIHVKAEQDIPEMAVKVYTKEGHESVFHTKWIDLMPEKYHIEVVGPKGQSVHRDVAVRFNETIDIPVSFELPKAGENSELGSAVENGTKSGTPESTNESTNESMKESKAGKKKKRWFQFWRSGEEKNDSAAEETSGSGIDPVFEKTPEMMQEDAIIRIGKPAAK